MPAMRSQKDSDYEHDERFHQEAKARGVRFTEHLRQTMDDQNFSNKQRKWAGLAAMRHMVARAKKENRELTTAESEDFETLSVSVSQWSAQAKLEQIEMDEHAVEAFGGKAKNGPTPSGWHDSETGRPVAVYGAAERLGGSSESARGTPTAGDAITAMITGKGPESVRNALGEGTDSSGGFLVPEPLSRDLIDRMRAKSRIIQAGARTVLMENETLSIAGIAADPVPAWRLENDLITKSNPSFRRLDFRARWLGVLVTTSRELVEDSPNAGDAINMAIAGALAAAWDKAALFGSGDAPEPLGLTGTVGVHEISMGDNGAAIANYSQLLQALSMTSTANAEKPTAMILAPRTLYQDLSGLVDSTFQPLEAPRALRDIPMLETSGVPIDEEHGTATTASRIILGDFSQMLLGIRSTVRVEIMRELFGERHQLGIVSWMRADVGVVHPAAFAQVTGIIPA